MTTEQKAALKPFLKAFEKYDSIYRQRDIEENVTLAANLSVAEYRRLYEAFQEEPQYLPQNQNKIPMPKVLPAKVDYEHHAWLYRRKLSKIPVESK